MIARLVVVSALVAAVSASLAADRYPAGLNPALCPNYPHCDNALLALHNNGLGPVPVYAPAAPTVWGGREYPAGVSPAACPNYPYCNVGVHVAPLPGYAQREYPAGVSPAACPNYPYCH